MKLRNVLAGAVGMVGATALANRLLQSRADGFEPFLDGEQGTYRWRGFDIAYTELGDGDDEDLLLLHGISAGASNHEFYRVADRLAEQYHVIAPDLPAFGHSDRPPLLYSASLYETFVGDAIADLCEDDPVVVASSLTGSYAASAAADAAVDRLVLICPTDETTGEQRVWVRGLLRSPLLGEALFNCLVSKPALRYFNTEHAYDDPANLTPAVVEYEWQSAHQPGARFAPASFVAGFLDPEASLAEHLAGVDAPVTLVWGRNADLPPLSTGRSIAEAADTGLVVVDRAKLLPHVEHPDQFVDIVSGEIAMAQ